MQGTGAARDSIFTNVSSRPSCRMSGLQLA